MDVLVAGGGIAGLATAIAVRNAGHHVQVIERASAPNEVGAGLAIWPNGRRALEAIGAGDIPGLATRSLQLRDDGGRRLSEMPLSELKKRFGYDLILVRRRDLHGALLALLGPAAVTFGAEITGFEQNQSRVAAQVASGERLTADVLIGADGIRSTVRRALLGDGDPRFSGATCWRGVTTFGLEAGTAFNWWGRGGEFGIFPLTDGGAYWFGVQNRPRGEQDSPRGRKEDARQAFASWPPVISAVIEATEPAAILRNDLYDRPPARSWSHGRVTLAGDAAHPMLPNAAQGACQAFEDAVALANALRTGSVEDGLRLYESRRLRAANAVVSQARRSARAVQSTNPLVTTARNWLARLAPPSLLLRQLDSVMLPGRDATPPKEGDR